MIVTLDGERLDLHAAPECTLQNMVDRVRRERLADRLVVGVAINGEPIVDEALQLRLAAPMADCEQLDLQSGEPHGIIADAFRTVAAALDEAGRSAVETAEQLNAGRTAEAVRRFGDIVQVWQNCRDAIVHGSALLGRDLATENAAGRPVAEHLQELVTRLSELRDCLNNRDFVLLADLAHYELPALCETWRSVLEQLADTIESPRA